MLQPSVAVLSVVPPTTIGRAIPYEVGTSAGGGSGAATEVIPLVLPPTVVVPLVLPYCYNYICYPIDWNMLGVTDRVVIFDTETNGLNPETSDILSLGWIKLFKFNGQWLVMNHCEYYVKNDTVRNSGQPLEINQITDEFRNAYGCNLMSILSYFACDIYGCDLYAYEVKFDVGFLVKYGFDVYQYARSVNELRVNEGESVINAVQRIVYSYDKDFSYWIPMVQRLHTAFDDTTAEMIIFLHEHARVDEETLIQFLVKREQKYEPVVGTGIYKNVPISTVVEQDKRNWVRWFVNIKNTPFEDYLREYIRDHFKEFQQ